MIVIAVIAMVSTPVISTVITTMVIAIAVIIVSTPTIIFLVRVRNAVVVQKVIEPVAAILAILGFSHTSRQAKGDEAKCDCCMHSHLFSPTAAFKAAHSRTMFWGHSFPAPPFLSCHAGTLSHYAAPFSMLVR